MMNKIYAGVKKQNNRMTIGIRVLFNRRNKFTLCKVFTH